MSRRKKPVTQKEKGRDNRSVPFIDLSYETERVRRVYLKALDAFFKKGNFILTPEVEIFEETWARFVGQRFAVGVSSGADALYLSLCALGIGPGVEIITQGNAYNASVVAILRTGATPRFADINLETLTISPKAVSALINRRTAALLPVHLYGQLNDMAALTSIAEKHKLAVVEDCAQAHGAHFLGRGAGTWGEVGVWSFYPTKILGAFGDAGAITTSDPACAARVRAMRNLGETDKNVHSYLGFNMRLDSIQALALNLKLPFLARSIKARRAAARFYERLIKKARVPVLSQCCDERAEHVYYLYVVLLPPGTDRVRVQAFMRTRGIATAVHYPTPVYRQPFYRAATAGAERKKSDPCPITDDVSRRILSLPLYVGITPTQQRRVITALADALSSV